MHIENMEKMMECLAEKAKSQIDGNFEQVDANELGQVVDMIKDLSEAKYYCTITKSMDDAKKEDELLAKLDRSEARSEIEPIRYYNDNVYRGGRIRPIYSKGGRRGYMDYKDYYPEVYDPNNEYYRNRDRMFYDGRSSNGMNSGNGSSSSGMGSSGNGSRSYDGIYYSNPSMTDPRYIESKYDRGRRNYTETKMNHTGNTPEDKAAKMSSLESYLKDLSEDMTELVASMDPSEKATVKAKLTTLAGKIV